MFERDLFTIGSMLFYKTYFAWNSYRILTESYRKLDKSLKKMERLIELKSPIKVFIDKHWLKTITIHYAILWEKNDFLQFSTLNLPFFLYFSFLHLTQFTGFRMSLYSWCILLKRSLESVARISLYYCLQTPADSERIERSSYNFQRMFPIWSSSIYVKSNSFWMTQV